MSVGWERWLLAAQLGLREWSYGDTRGLSVRTQCAGAPLTRILDAAQMSFASMQTMANQRAINQKPRRRKPQPRPEWSTNPSNPEPRAATGGARGPVGLGATWDGATGLPQLVGGAAKGGGARREVVHGRRASGSGTPSGGRRGPGGSGRGPRVGGAVARTGPTRAPEPAPMMPQPSLVDQAPLLTEEQILSMTDEEVEEMLAKVRNLSSCSRHPSP